MNSRTLVFTRIARELMGPPPLTVPANMPIADVVGRMTGEKCSSVLVRAGDGGLAGIVTEQDIVRRIACRATPRTPVGEVMTPRPMTIREDEHLYRVIARMRRYGLRHMPVVSADGQAVGVLELHTALAAASEQMVDQIERLAHEDTIDGLREVKAAQVDLAAELFAENIPAPEIQYLLTDINNDIYHRVVERSLADMAEEGHGAPPVSFAVIVMGSGGRGENFLYPDQDNGFVIADYPDAEHDRIDGWFRELADRMTSELDTIGLPLCKGYVMAVNPLWRKTISQWKAQLAIWQKRRNEVTLRLSDIFFDFRAVWGEQSLADDLHDTVVSITRGNPSFLQAMYRDDEEHGVALGLFGRFVTVREDGPGKGKINLKHSGTLPLVEGLRLLALREGITSRSSLGRIEALAAAGVLDPDEQDFLSGAYGFITRLLLRQQIADFQAGLPVGNFVAPRSLSRRERVLLKEYFRAIRRFRDRLKSEFTGEIF